MANGFLTLINKSGGLKFISRTILLVLLAVCAAGVNAQTRNITGTVTDEAGDPMAGVSVLIKGTRQGTSTDIDGKYALKAERGAVLEFSYIGYTTQTVTVNIHNVIDITMQEDVKTLDEVVVVAYGTQKKSSITGAISQVTSADIANRPVSSVTSALEGASSGINVTGAIGQPGTSSTISIRGIGTVTGNNNPLIVLDGVPFDGNMTDIAPDDIESISVLKDAASCALYGNRASNGVILLTTKKSKANKPTFTFKTSQGWFERGQSDYARVNPYQFMEVEYANLYNGQISSKGLDRSNPADMATARQYVMNELVNSRTVINIFDTPVTEMFDANGKMNPGVRINPLYAEDLDWYDQSIRKGYRAEYSFAGTGATERSDYYFSVNYLDENGYTKDSGFERLTGRASINIKPTKWFKTGLQLNASHQKTNDSAGRDGDENSSSTTNPFYFYRVIAPIYPVHLHDVNTGEYILDADGNRQYDPGYYQVAAADGTTQEVPTRYQLQANHSIWESEMNHDRRVRNTSNSTAYADFIFPYGFTFTLKGNLSTRNEERSSYGSAVIGGSAKGTDGKLSKTIYNYKTWTFQQQLNWNHTYGKHFINVLLGHENYSYKRDYTYTRAQGVKIEGLEALVNFTTPTDATGYAERYRTESYLGRVQYSYNDRYNIEGSFRRDGGSRFSSKVRWGNFGSVGANWLFTAEDFMKDQTWITNGKLRANWGQVGNDAGSGPYAYYSLYGSDIKGGNAAYVMSQLANPDLFWETGESWGIGLEARLFNRWNLSVEYYDKRNNDLLFDVNNPISGGGTSFDYAESVITKNFGSISNRGIEINTDVDIFTNRDWTVNLAANLTTLKNKMVKMPGQYKKDGLLSGSQKIIEGKSRYEWYTYHWAGVDMMDGMSLYDANLDDYHVVAPDGSIIGGTYDNGELVSTELKEDAYKCIDGKYYVNTTTYAKRDFRGKALPDLYGSFTANVSWKNFSLSAMMTYSVGGKIMDSGYSSLMSLSSSYVRNYHKDILNSWNGVPEGMTETSPNRINRSINPVIDMTQTYNNSTSDRFLISRNYVCLKNINFAYSLPKSLIRPLTLTSARLYFSAENVVTSTKRTGLAATQRLSGYVYNQMPPARVFTFGLNVSF